MPKKILVTEPSLPPFEEYVNEIRSIWDSKWLTNMGEKHQQLEKQLCTFLHVPGITLFVNGHTALESALEILHLQGEVITTPFTFASTTHAIVRQGLTPVFADVKDDCTIDPDDIERKISSRTCAIVPVHVYGHCCDVQRIQEIADRHHLKVVYDAAHAFGETVDGAGIASFGDMSMFSFHATKVFNTIEGGAVAYSNPEYERPLYCAKNFGILNEEEVVTPAGNAKMNEFQAAMGLCNLRHFDEAIRKRKHHYELYLEKLDGIRGIRVFPVQEGVQSNYAYFPVLVDGYSLSRDQLKNSLEKYGFGTRKYFYPLISDFACYRNQYDSRQTPKAKHMADCVLALPLYENLDEESILQICRIIRGGGEIS